MNLKTAKQLRKMAKALALESNITSLRELFENESRRKYNFSLKRNEEGNVLIGEDGKPQYNVHFVAAGQMVNSHQTLRGIYRNLKRGVKNQKPLILASA